MDVTTKAVALKTTDYKENDKMVLLYSLEYGKISVQAKGVRKSSAKLKFACDQFCFGQYELVKSGDRFTLKTCDQLESFFALREDIVAYYAACVVAECLVNYTEEGQSEPKLFVTTLKALEALVNNVNPLTVALKYVLDFLRLAGFGLDLSENGGVSANAQVVACVRNLGGLAYDKLDNLDCPQATMKEALATCNRYLSHNFYPLKTVNELIKLA